MREGRCTSPKLTAFTAVRAVIGSLLSLNAIHHHILSPPWARTHSLLMRGMSLGEKLQKNVYLQTFTRRPSLLWGCPLSADLHRKSPAGQRYAQDSDAIRMFQLILGEGRNLIAQRNQIEDRAVTLLKDHPDYQLLTSIPGIGPINALTILAEAGDLRRFGHHRQFLKLCGMDLATIQSGTFRGQTKLSKYGNARLRRTLWMAGQVAILQRANSFRDKFERYVAKDRHNTHLRRKAYTAIAAKMARTVHGIIKNGEPYPLAGR
jgi:hypothetical protein